MRFGGKVKSLAEGLAHSENSTILYYFYFSYLPAVFTTVPFMWLV